MTYTSEKALDPCSRRKQRGSLLRTLGIVVLAALAGLSPMSERAAGQAAKHALTNDDVRAMAKKGFTDDLIVSAVEANPTQFDVSVDGLMALKDGGISDKVITAMLKAEAHNRDDARSAAATAPAAQPAAPPPAAMPPANDPMAMAQQMMGSMGGMGGMMGGGFAFDPRQLPVVTLNTGDAKQPMRAAFSQIAHTQGGDLESGGGNATRALTGLASQSLSFAAIGGLGMMAGPAAGLAMGMMGGMGSHHGPPKVTHVWALPGHQSENPLKLPALKFEVVYGNLLGIDPDSYEPVLLRLVQTNDNWRLVGATKVQMGRESAEALAKIAEVRIATRLTRVGRGDLLLEPQSPLQPGEYGLVLRPINPGKRAKGSLGGPAETNAFFSVWDFSLQ